MSKHVSAGNGSDTRVASAMNLCVNFPVSDIGIFNVDLCSFRESCDILATIHNRKQAFLDLVQIAETQDDA